MRFGFKSTSLAPIHIAAIDLIKRLTESSKSTLLELQL